MFNPTTAQQLNTEVYNHMASHIHVSAFFWPSSGRYRTEENTSLATYIMDV
jgi:hypothetical protein